MAVIVGTEGDEHLGGTNGDDTISGLGGMDTLNGGTGGSDTLDGGEGDDQITALLSSFAHVFGGGGGDHIWTGAGNDEIHGGEGPDDIYSDYYGGSAGNDTVFGDGGDDSVEAGPGNDTLWGGPGRDALHGGLGNDILYGEDGDDSLLSGSGLDEMYGAAGADHFVIESDGTLNGAPTKVYGADGNDIVYVAGPASGHTIDGGADLDTVIIVPVSGGATINLVTQTITRDGGTQVIVSFEAAWGSWANDTLIGDATDNWLLGSIGSDFLEGGLGDDTIMGGHMVGRPFTPGGYELIHNPAYDRDTVSYAHASGPVQVYLKGVNLVEGYADGADGHDRLFLIDHVIGSEFNDIIEGTDNPFAGYLGDPINYEGNYLYGAGGDDIIRGFNGLDFLTGGVGADLLDGGNGVDTARYDSALSGVTVDLVLGIGSAGEATGDTLISIESLVGSGFDDTLIGNGVDNSINAGSGADLLIGNGGADFLFGGDGNDVITGNDGNDSIGGWNGFDWLEGGDGADWISAGSGDDRLEGGAGNDTLDGQAGWDTMYGGVGDDVYYVDDAGDDPRENSGEGYDIVFTSVTWAIRPNIEIVFLAPGAGGIIALGDAVANVLVGNEVANVVAAYGGNDWIEGRGGNDWLEGWQGDDRIEGGDGADRLDGGQGSDVLIGGANNDTFVYNAISDSSVASYDSIRDFQVGLDKVNLAAVRTGGADSFHFVYAYGNSYLFVDLGGGGDDMLIELTGTPGAAASDVIWS